MEPEEKMEFKTRLGESDAATRTQENLKSCSRLNLLLLLLLLSSGRNIYRVVFKSGASERNELFLPGRMAYVVDLDDEFTDTDIPTTLIRSKADCPSMEVGGATSTSRNPNVPLCLLIGSCENANKLMSLSVCPSLSRPRRL